MFSLSIFVYSWCILHLLCCKYFVLLLRFRLLVFWVSEWCHCTVLFSKCNFNSLKTGILYSTETFVCTFTHLVWQKHNKVVHGSHFISVEQQWQNFVTKMYLDISGNQVMKCKWLRCWQFCCCWIFQSMYSIYTVYTGI